MSAGAVEEVKTRCAATLPADPPMDCQAPDCHCAESSVQPTPLPVGRGGLKVPQHAAGGGEGVGQSTPTPRADAARPVPADVLTDAARWRALMACVRIRTLGYSISPDTHYGHIWLELWTRYDFPPGTDDDFDRECFATFMDKAVLAAAALNANPPKEPPHDR